MEKTTSGYVWSPYERKKFTMSLMLLPVEEASFGALIGHGTGWLWYKICGESKPKYLM